MGGSAASSLEMCFVLNNTFECAIFQFFNKIYFLIHKMKINNYTCLKEKNALKDLAAQMQKVLL